MLIVQRFYKANAPLCRQHGKELAAKWLGLTLVHGWWGYIGFFINFFDVGTDVVAMIRFSRLRPPFGPSGVFRTRLNAQRSGFKGSCQADFQLELFDLNLVTESSCQRWLASVGSFHS